jgi:phage/plasmid-associated DNA primase
MFKLYMTCNAPPKVNTTDPAFWNRIAVLPYESVFVPRDLCPENPDDQKSQKVFQDDIHISVRLQELKATYMAMLIEKYKDLCYGRCKKLRPADVPKIKTATQIYRENSDIMGKFLRAKFNITHKFDDKTTVEEVLKLYRAYLSDLGINSTPCQSDVINYLAAAKFQYVDPHFCGLKRKDNVDADNADAKSEAKSDVK